MNKSRLIIFFLCHHIIITMGLKVRNIDCERYKNKCSSANSSTLVYPSYIIYNIKNKPRTLLSKNLLHYRDVWNQPSTNISHIFCVILYILYHLSPSISFQLNTFRAQSRCIFIKIQAGDESRHIFTFRAIPSCLFSSDFINLLRCVNHSNALTFSDRPLRLESLFYIIITDDDCNTLSTLLDYFS